MVTATVLIGLIVWAVLDYIQTRNIRNIFLSQMNERLEKQAEEDSRRLDRYIMNFQQSVSVYLQAENFTDYINKQKWQAKDKIKTLGGKMKDNVGKETDYVVAGDNPGSKYEKAKELKVRIISEEEFLKIIK